MKCKFFESFALSFVIMAICLTSCSKDVMLESEESVEANSTLIVSTRAEVGDGTDLKVSYPVTVYIFDVSGICKSVSVLDKAGDVLKLKLMEGMYHVCAVAGAGSDYVLPSLEDAKMESVISLKQGKEHADLMYAKNSVVILAGETNKLDLSLERKVMMMQEVKISNVPETVTGVSVTIAPLYENLCLDGTYSGINGSRTVTLTNESGTGVWKNTDGIYLLEASGNTTVTVRMTDAEGTKSYSYSFSNGLKANYRIRIEGTYISKEGILLSGTTTGAEWAGERIISFSFNEDGSSGTGTVPGGENVIEGEAPFAGTMYEGCYVLSNSKNGDGSITVVLMSGTNKFGLQFDAGDQTSVSSAVSQAIAELAVDGIERWRLPSLEEVKAVVSGYDKINKVLKGAGAETIVPDLSFFYVTDEGTISSYCVKGNPDFGKATRLRAFATLIFKQ